jgi:hypothetical protein
MKRVLLLISLLLCICAGRSQSADSGSFVLKGKITGKDTGYIYLMYQGANGLVSDSFYLQKGAFLFKGDLLEPVEINFSTFNFISNNQATYDSKNLSTFYIEPGQMNLLATKGSLRELHLDGSRSDNERVRLLRMKDTIEAKFYRL